MIPATGTITTGAEVVGAAGVAVGNTAVGVLVHQGVLQDVRKWG
jgi:hypothetical protein